MSADECKRIDSTFQKHIGSEAKKKPGNCIRWAVLYLPLTYCAVIKHAIDYCPKCYSKAFNNWEKTHKIHKNRNKDWHPANGN